MEKINYLQRRVVFLENELADAAASHSEEEGGGGMEETNESDIELGDAAA